MAVYNICRSHSNHRNLKSNGVEALVSVCIHHAVITPGLEKAFMISERHLIETETAWCQRFPFKGNSKPRDPAEANGCRASPASSFVHGEMHGVIGGCLSAGVKTAEQKISKIGRSL
ncbi:MAG: hypothetical protein NXI13_08505 [Proteobacteria bacterium]|nr:hypothetical protein [Pseudomonadota bacterium]